MGLVCFLLYALLWILPFASLLFVSRRFRRRDLFTYAGWYPLLKVLYFKASIEKYQRECKKIVASTKETYYETPRDLSSEDEIDSHILYGLDSKGNAIVIKMALKHSLHAEVFIEFRLDNGKIYNLPNQDGVVICSIASKQWKAQGLYIQVLEPFRRLRITYNGFLKNVASDKSKEDSVEHVQFHLVWNAASKPMHHPQDMDLNLLTSTFARESWHNSEHAKVLTSESGYEQFGCLDGFLKGSAYPDELTFRLPSWRKRFWGLSKSISLKRDHFVFGACKNGTVFCFGIKELTKSTEPFKYGFVLLNNGKCLAIEGSDMNLEQCKIDDIPERTVFNIKVNKDDVRCIVNFNRKDQTHSKNNEKYGWHCTLQTAECDLDGSKANALATYWESVPGVTTCLPKPLLHERPAKSTENILVCRLNDSACLDLSLTGGKANSLGLLSSINSDWFVVPEGFVVTVSAYKRQLQTKPHLVKAIEKLENVCHGKVETNIEEICKETSDLFSKEMVSEDIAKLVMLEVSKINDSMKDNMEMKSWRWAVRSSGVGEDSDELSAAGQNSTFLGCKDEDILRAISACWGSLYTFQSVQYRRQHGLSINCEMGVVVQKTVPADCAGVLFTCHPATSDPSKMIITSNYGLGESVVSATADPDTIVLSRTYDGNITVSESTVGNKKTQVVLDTDAKELEGTSEKLIDDELAKKLSITEEQAVRLGKVAVLLEEAFGSPRDIEWAFCKDKLFLLQSRPITTLTTWSDYELLHEFDTPVLSDDNLYTRVNIGEVMKGALTVLTRSSVLETIDVSSQKDNTPPDQFNPYVSVTCPTMLHHGFLDVFKIVYQRVPAKINVSLRVTELAFVGYPLMDEKLHAEAIRRNGVQGRIKKSIHTLQMLKKLWKANDYMRKAEDISKNWNIGLKRSDGSLETFNKIENSLYMIGEIIALYGSVVFSSVFFQMIALNVLVKGSADFTEEHFHDISLILCTNAGIETVETPVVLEKIASVIRNAGKAKEFIELDSADGLDWLKHNCAEAAEIFAKFLEDRGHRLFKEYEMHADTWAEDPAPLIEMIQLNCRTETISKKAQGLTVEETIDNLVTPQSNLSKKLLKFLINKLRSSLVLRETTKSHVIRALGKFRTAYKQLASKMVSEGYLPEAELIYHLTRTELEELLRDRNPALLTKAMRRKRLYPKWNTMQFSDISKGFPVPDRDGSQDDIEIIRTGGEAVEVSGTPVCPGKIVARACVIADLKECVQIQPGDILITYSTDVGWTPYFPMLTGLVTEIGGLVSHGAVVAREYGLPSLVGVRGATKAFKTGDRVLLNSKVGVLQLVTEEEKI